MGFHGCLSCGKPITWRFALCSDCELLYGKKATEWPEWLRWLWNDTQKQRRRERKKLQNEILFTELDTKMQENGYDT